MAAPAITLPKGGGAIRGIGEKFAANPVTGTGSMTVPLAVSPGRSGFGPQLALSYDSGLGNGPFGLGWSLALPAITRKTDKGLPQYHDAEDSDVFILSGTEDLVPALMEQNIGEWIEVPVPDRVIGPDTYSIRRYRPRIEGLFARIERWTRRSDGDSYWRSISRDNVTTLYGKTTLSRICDPDDPSRVFSWLICESYDDKGNAIAYAYTPENSDNVATGLLNERNRTLKIRGANRYLKRIKYGNKKTRIGNEQTYQDSGWHFEVVLDYGEGHCTDLADRGDGHDYVKATSTTNIPWPARKDPHSSFRSGFEVRSYRLCRRVLMFHDFAELGANACLVRSTDFVYEEDAVASFITAVTQSGYVRQRDGSGRFGDEYLTKSTPPVEFTYSKVPTPVELSQQPVHDIDSASLANLPAGLDVPRYQFVDLDGEGVSGILAEKLGAWYYKPNLGDAAFGPMFAVPSIPSMAVPGGKHQLLDLAGDGQLDVVLLDAPAPGFFARNEDLSWEPFRRFVCTPQVDWGDSNLRFLDLTGDGHADLVITENDAFVWHASLAEDGFGPALRVAQALDEEKGPRLVFADGTQTVFLSDMSGDGLTDLVRIRNGAISYWPNLGYGRFGAKVAMENAPWFDAPDRFDARRIQLADTDGSGTVDVVYLGDRVQLYFNQSGNALSDAVELPQFPRFDSAASVQVMDLLGGGTACLVWSSPLVGAAGRQMRYIDLMGGQKPHLLVRIVNNLGAETLVQYASSSKFYLKDKREGKPWITRLPFPVQVVERVDTRDLISGNRFVTRYTYHHGHFDGVEREFRGFGMVEQRDTEEFAALSANSSFPNATNLDESSHVPPVLTCSWFHTGVYKGRDRVSNYFAGLPNDEGEYYREPDRTDPQAAKLLLLDDTVLPPGLTPEEEREACRALKGSMLRQEIYALDHTPKEKHPYVVVEQNFTIRKLQPKAKSPHAVFLIHPCETIQYHYERNPSDPRVSHTLTLETDEFANVLKSASIAYGRRRPDASLAPADQAAQARTLVTYTENGFTNEVGDADDYHVPAPCESCSYELTGYAGTGPEGRFASADLVRAVQGKQGLEHVFDGEIAYEIAPTTSRQRRPIEHIRILYRRDYLAGSLPLGELQPRALPFESYKLAFTPGLVNDVYGARVTDAIMDTEGRYVHSEGDANWWIPSGRMFYSPGAQDTPQLELAFAEKHFFLPHRYRDPLHSNQASTETFVRYDGYDMLIEETRDAFDNLVTVGERDPDPTKPLKTSGQNYRILQPALVMDANRNRMQFVFDALGMVVGTAVAGKPEDNPRCGDLLDGFAADLPEATIAAHMQAPLADSPTLLQRATARFVYDLVAFQRSASRSQREPVALHWLTRETHDADLGQNEKTRLQHGFSYFDGFGREIQKKTQAEPGAVPRRDQITGRIVLANGRPNLTGLSDERWVGSGWTVFNNKGNPVRKFEPFFTDTHKFEFEVQIGVSAIRFYDPPARLIATLHPNQAWEKVVFDSWRQEVWDANDTVRVDPKVDSDVGRSFTLLLGNAPFDSWYSRRAGGGLGADERAAAVKTAAHAGTASLTCVDAVGRSFLSLAHQGFDAQGKPIYYRTTTAFDIEGNARRVTDARSRTVVRYDYDMLGNRVHEAGMEAGERWVLNDSTGKQVRAWDGRGHQFRTEYDRLRRPVRRFVRGTDSNRSDPRTLNLDVLFEQLEYGEGQANDLSLNLRTHLFRQSDGSGSSTTEAYDFKGNSLTSTRRVAKEYKKILDWSSPVQTDAPLQSSRTYDALNRAATVTTPDGSIVRPTYNEANLLEAVSANLRGERTASELVWRAFVVGIDYDEKGQRARIDYATRDGKNFSTTYKYDLDTFRLVAMRTRRNAAVFDAADRPGEAQNLRYTYDPTGNILHIGDDAQQTIYFRNRRVEPSNDYTYDALYRLIQATGREHLGLNGGGAPLRPTPSSYNDRPRIGLLHPGDGNAIGTYTEAYEYDEVGNFKSCSHRGTDPLDSGWTRTFTYDADSLLKVGVKSNRLTRTTLNPNGAEPEDYSYDPHGNMTSMPQLQAMLWDFQDRMYMSTRQRVNLDDQEGIEREGERTYYMYDASGQRVRKVTELGTGDIKDERVYIGGYEVYRRRGIKAIVRETLHIVDDRRRIALVETRVEGDDGSPEKLIRYQLGNHLGSAALELDETGQIIAYEEYFPYGGTSYQAGRSVVEAGLKRYRHLAGERDEESGLYYNHTRYRAPWLGRWISCDPINIAGGINVYALVADNPLLFVDPAGHVPVDWTKERQRHTRVKAGEMQDNVSDAAKAGKVPDPMQAGAAQATKSPVEMHHHADIDQASKVNADPQAVGNPSRMSAVWSRKSATVRGGVGDTPVWDPNFKGKTLTHHNVAKALDKAEQTKSSADAEGLNQASATSKARLPATADMSERAKMDWTAKRPVGPDVNPADGKVIPSSPPTTASAKAAPSAPPPDSPAQAPKPQSALTPENVKAPTGESLGARIGAGVDAATPFAAKALNAAALIYAAHDISNKTAETAREQGAAMGAAQFAKTSAKHASAFLWFAAGAAVAVALATGGAAAPLAAAAIGALITTVGTQATHNAIDQLTPGLR